MTRIPFLFRGIPYGNELYPIPNLLSPKSTPDLGLRIQPLEMAGPMRTNIVRDMQPLFPLISKLIHQMSFSWSPMKYCSMSAPILGSKFCSGKISSSRVSTAEMSAVCFFEAFKSADGFGGAHLSPVTGFKSRLSSFVNLARISPPSHL